MKLGIQIGASTPPGDLPAIARLAEETGYEEIWLAEDYFELGGIASVASALAATNHIAVGLGVVAAAVRHPAVTAMEFATLGGAYPGRFMAGLGHGAPGWVRQMGLTAESPMTLLREVAGVVRSLLAGDTVSQAGDYFELNDVSLDHPTSARVPIYFGVQGPASLRLSGEIADGTLLGWFSSPGSVAWARDRIEEGRRRGGRDGHHEIAALCLLAMTEDDPERESRALAGWGAGMLAQMAHGKPLAEAEEGAQLRAIVADAGREGLAEAIPLDLLRTFAATGSPEDCAASVQRLLSAGADRVVLVPNPASYRPTSEMVEQIALAQTLLG
ncbi:MAG: LLM class flavin-dependent oxidoreductase [Acidimicrobiia bacterium]|nr:LLM class flavin-dependent oxidoreductase [Acidimicrobiia bacterium]